VQIPEAEPLECFRARVCETVKRLIAAPEDGAGRAAPAPAEELVIVSHGGVIAALLADWLGAGYDHLLRRLALDNAGISAVDCHVNPPCVLWVNATEHLTNHR
jgi:broad specificity phosphatase PhoE